MRGGETDHVGAAADGRWFTKSEAAAYARVSVTTIDRAVRSGVLRAGGTPHRRLFKQVWLDAWLGAFLLLLALLLLGCLLDVACACDLASVG